MRSRECGAEGIALLPVRRFKKDHVLLVDDPVSIERPLQINISDSLSGYIPRELAITMRTPGDDEALAVGYLFTEGIIQEKADVKEVNQTGTNGVCVILREGVSLDLQTNGRHSYVSSSCGVCGKRAIEQIQGLNPHSKNHPSPLRITPSLLHSLPIRLREAQREFSQTGGLHASALFDQAGQLVELREDVGRHNALDKLIGSQLLSGPFPLQENLLLLSGRISFELVQKASSAGITMIAAIGAPSSLAVELAEKCRITLIGFLKEDRFNLYTGEIQGTLC